MGDPTPATGLEVGTAVELAGDSLSATAWGLVAVSQW